jgi:RNA polymerase sigma-70 factor (ECF subfamily)
VNTAVASTDLLASDLEGATARAHAAARAVLGCDHLAADAVQEALVALWRAPAAPPDLHGWLVLAVVHRSRALRRRLLRRKHHEHCAAAHCPLHDGCDNPLHHARAHELGERLDAAVSRLPEEQRAPFELYAATPLDYRGIAARLRLPVGTIRSRLHRARSTLQRMLRDERSDD